MCHTAVARDTKPLTLAILAFAHVFFAPPEQRPDAVPHFSKKRRGKDRTTAISDNLYLKNDAQAIFIKCWTQNKAFRNSGLA